MSARYRSSACAGLVLALAGCSDKDIASYRVPKEPGASSPAALVAASATGAQPGLHWEAPPGWQAQEASGLRAASFLAPGPGGATADVSVVTFGGPGGDTLANINRWRGQLKLAPISAGELPSQVSALEGPAGHFSIADIRGEPAQGKAAVRILGAWLVEPGQVWFFKMMGPEDVVEAQKDVFYGFLRSVAQGTAAAGTARAEPGGAKAAANTNDLPHANFAVVPTKEGGENTLRWEAPADWKPKPATAIRKGSFSITRGAEAADMSITAFPGDVGGLSANVNRWRSQVGLPALDDSAMGTVTEVFDANGLHFTMVDFAGTEPSGQQRILAAFAPWQGGTWFFKLTGPAALVEDEKPAFAAFLKTVRPK